MVYFRGNIYVQIRAGAHSRHSIVTKLVSFFACIGGGIQGTGYGVQSRVYSVPNSLIITIIIPDQPPMTQLCRMQRKGNDLDAVEQYSNLGRCICAQTPDLETAMQWLEETEKKRKQYRFPVVLAGYILVAWGFSIFFGGSLMDSLCAAACGTGNRCCLEFRGCYTDDS